MNKSIFLIVGVLLLLNSPMFAAAGGGGAASAGVIVQTGPLKYEEAYKMLQNASEETKLETLVHIFKKRGLKNDSEFYYPRAPWVYRSLSSYNRNKSCVAFFNSAIDVLRTNIEIIEKEDFISLSNSLANIELEEANPDADIASENINIVNFYGKLINAVDIILTRYESDQAILNASKVHAATKIQKVVRGHQGRKRAQDVKRERPRQEEELARVAEELL